MKKLNSLIFLLFIFSIQIQAQQVIAISKSEVIEKVINENATIKISEQEHIKAVADFKQTNSVYLPNITASYTGMATTNPLMAFGSKLNQEILTQNDFNPILLNDPSQIENFATRFEIQQPLINVDGIYQRKAAKTSMEAMLLRSQRTTDHMILEVEKAYMQMQLAYKGVDVLNKVLKATEANKKLANDRYDQGYIQHADVLSIEVRLSEVKGQLQKAKSNVENASNYLSLLMNENDFVLYRPSDSLTANASFKTMGNNISENRSDIKAMQLATQSFDAMNKADKMAFLPRLNAFGSYELYDDEIFQADANGYSFGAQLSWNIFEGSKRFGKAKKSKAEFEKAKLEYDQYVSKSKLELNKARRMLIDSENQLKLTALAIEQSKEALRIRTLRFEEGLEKTSDLLMAETQYAQKQLEHYQTIFEYNFTQSYIQFLTKE